MRKIILGAAAAAALLSSTPAFAASSQICIRHDDIRNWSATDDKHLVLENYSHQKALLTLIGTCSGFRFAETIVIRSPGAFGLSCIERGDSVRARERTFPGTCSIAKIEPYTGPVGKNHDSSNANSTNAGGSNNTGDPSSNSH